MTNLDEKVKNEIVDAQIKYLRKEQPNNLINYDSLKGYLSEAIREYFPEDLLNKEPDYDLLMKLEKIETKNWKGEPMSYGSGNAIRLRHAITTALDLNLSFGDKITNKQFVEFYNNPNSLKTRNYGMKSQKLLRDYLTKKGLI